MKPRENVSAGHGSIGLLLLAAVAAGGCSNAGDDAWNDPITIVESGATQPTTAVDPRGGAAYVAWVGDEAGTTNVRLVRIERSGEITPPVRVNDVPGDATPHQQAPAQVAVGPEGTVYVAWQKSTEVEGRRFPSSDLRLARSTDRGGSFGPAITISEDPAGIPTSRSFHDLVVRADGTLHVSWIDSGRRDRHRRTHPEADDSEAPGQEVRVATSVDGGRSFGPGIVVDSGVCPCCRTSLAAGSGDTIYVAWRKISPEAGGGTEVRDIVVAASTDGGRSFTSPVRPAEDRWRLSACPHAGPDLRTDEEGSVHIAWYTGKEGGTGLYYARADGAGLAFGPAVPLVTGSTIPPSRTTLAPAADGMWLAWESGADAGGPIFRLARGAGDGSAPARARDQAGAGPDLAAGEFPILAWNDRGAIRVRIGPAGELAPEP